MNGPWRSPHLAFPGLAAEPRKALEEAKVRLEQE
jgi:hypothetical protein